jgi:hypothetical protein
MSDLLRQVLAERSTAPASPTDVRLVRVRRRIVRRRRIRVAAAVGTAVVVVALLLLGTALVSGGPAGLRQGPVGSPAPTMAGFPAYSQGAHLVAGGEGSYPNGVLTVDYTPTSTDLVLFTWCDAPGLGYDIWVNGRPAETGYCVGDGFLPIGSRHELGILAGVPNTFTMSVQPTGASTPVPGPDAFRLGIGQSIPFDDYPFPPAPATLSPLPSVPPAAAQGGVDPLAPRQITFSWPGGQCVLWVELQGPGQIEVELNGSRIGLVQQWDYNPAPTTIQLNARDQPSIPIGQSMKITLIPLHMKSGWVAIVEPT